MQIRAGSDPLDARLEVQYVDGQPTIVVESRGGKPVRNADYNDGVELILERLGRLGATLTAVVVDSAHTRRMHLPFEDRLLDSSPNSTFPIALAGVEDVSALRLALGASQAQVGRAPGARGGGNYTKRIRLYVTFDGSVPPQAKLERALAFDQ